tara:strand:+ start:227 stop:1069 length:843 start_codon:yes stop_codon:yes gene_type:complete
MSLKQFKNMKNSFIKNIKNKFYTMVEFYNYSEAEHLTSQEYLFKKNNIDRTIGEKKLKLFNKKYFNKLKVFDKTDFSIMNESSEHSLLLGALSENKNIKKILEIGTGSGLNALLLSYLFPDSEITSIDLPDNADLFIDSYNRNEDHKRREFVKLRSYVLSFAKNVDFVEQDSVSLFHSIKNEFDLIWIDANHNYPYVTIDIINSLKILSVDGLIVCDDIINNDQLKKNTIYKSNAGYETLLALKKANIIRYELFYKRLDRVRNHSSNARKYLAYVKKVSP